MRRAISLLGLLAVLVAAGCGGSSKPKAQPHPNPLGEAAARTLAAGPVATAYEVVVSVPGKKRKLVFGGQGVLDDPLSRVTLDLGPLVFQPNTPKWQGRVLIDNSSSLTAYFAVPYFSQRARPKRPWVRIDLGATIKSQPVSVQVLALDANPGRYLQLLLDAKQVRRKGSVLLAGVQTTRYAAQVDLLGYGAKLPAARRTAAQFFGQRIVKVTKERFPAATAWVDGQGRVRRVTVTYAFPIGDTGQTFKYEITFSYSDFGKPKRLRVPPASEVTSEPSLTRLLARRG
jgi:nitrous oxide reductase accessory protein NosL